MNERGVALGGDKPASEIMRRSSVSLVRFFTPAAIRHFFLDEGAADIVGANCKPTWQTLMPGEPARLDVVEVVEIQTADGKRFK